MVLFSTFSYLFHVKNELYSCNGNYVEKKVLVRLHYLLKFTDVKKKKGHDKEAKTTKNKTKKINSGNSGTSLFISIFQLKIAVIDKLDVRDRSFFMSMGGLVGFRGGHEKKNGTKGGGYQKN